MKKRVITGFILGLTLAGAIFFGDCASAKTVSVTVSKADKKTAKKIEKYVTQEKYDVKLVCKGTDKLSATDKKNALKKASEIRIEYDLFGKVVSKYSPTEKEIQKAYKKNLQAAKKKNLKESVAKLKKAIGKKIGAVNGYGAIPRTTGTEKINYNKKTGTFTITKNDCAEYMQFFNYVKKLCKDKKQTVADFKKKSLYGKLSQLLTMNGNMAYGLSNDTEKETLTDNLQRMCKGTAKGGCEEFHVMFDFFCSVMGIEATPVISDGYVVSALAMKNDAGKTELLIGDRGKLSKYKSEDEFKTYMSTSFEITAKHVKEQFKDYPF